jgi:hypothetical protein
MILSRTDLEYHYVPYILNIKDAYYPYTVLFSIYALSELFPPSLQDIRTQLNIFP